MKLRTSRNIMFAVTLSGFLWVLWVFYGQPGRSGGPTTKAKEAGNFTDSPLANDGSRLSKPASGNSRALPFSAARSNTFGRLPPNGDELGATTLSEDETRMCRDWLAPVPPGTSFGERSREVFSICVKHQLTTNEVIALLGNNRITLSPRHIDYMPLGRPFSLLFNDGGRAVDASDMSGWIYSDKFYLTGTPPPPWSDSSAAATMGAHENEDPPSTPDELIAPSLSAAERQLCRNWPRRPPQGVTFGNWSRRVFTICVNHHLATEDVIALLGKPQIAQPGYIEYRPSLISFLLALDDEGKVIEAQDQSGWRYSGGPDQ